MWWSAQLRAVPLDENAASQKGIRRGADKARMPLQGLLYFKWDKRRFQASQMPAGAWSTLPVLHAWNIPATGTWRFCSVPKDT